MYKSSAHLTVEIAYCHLKKTGKKRSDSGMFYRIENNNGDIESKKYDLESLNDSLEFDVEVR